jgi:hypothetical protein
MVVWREPLFLVAFLVALNVKASNLTLNQKLTFDSLDLNDEEVRLRREAWAAGLAFY